MDFSLHTQSVEEGRGPGDIVNVSHGENRYSIIPIPDILATLDQSSPANVANNVP
jgi:hypothetical protein